MITMLVTRDGCIPINQQSNAGAEQGRTVPSAPAEGATPSRPLQSSRTGLEIERSFAFARIRGRARYLRGVIDERPADLVRERAAVRAVLDADAADLALIELVDRMLETIGHQRPLFAVDAPPFPRDRQCQAGPERRPPASGPVSNSQALPAGTTGDRPKRSRVAEGESESKAPAGPRGEEAGTADRETSNLAAGAAHLVREDLP